MSIPVTGTLVPAGSFAVVDVANVSNAASQTYANNAASSAVSAIPDATASVKGLATAAQISKLDALPADAQSASQVSSTASGAASAAVAGIPDATTLVKGLATTTQITKLDGLPSDAQSASQVSTAITNARLQVNSVAVTSLSLPSESVSIAGGVATVSLASSRSINFSDPSLVWFGPDGFQGGLCERKFHTTATSLDCTVRFTTSLGVSPLNEVCLIVDGTPQYITWNGSEGTVDGLYTVVTRTITLYSGSHDVTLRDGPANCVGYPAYLSVLAKFTALTANADITAFAQPAPRNAMIVVADSVGQGTGATHPTTDGYVVKLRDNHGSESSFSVVGAGGDAIGYHYAIDATMDTFARRIEAHCVGTETNTVYLQLGLNDYIQRVALGQSAAQFGTRLGLLLDKLRLRVPKAKVIVASPTLMSGDALTDWRTEAATACSTRKWVRYVNGATQTPITAWADGLHPNSAQYTVLYECIESIVGLWALGNLTGAITSMLPDDPRNVMPNNGLARAYDRGTEQPFAQATATLQPVLHAPHVDNVIDGPANCPYLQTTISGAQNALATFAASRVRCTIVLLIRFDGAAGTRQDVLSGDGLNTCTLHRQTGGDIQYYSNAFLTISPTTPVGWHVFEITRWNTAGYAWAKIDGGAEVELVATQASIGGLCFGRQNANSTFPSNASYGELAVVAGDPGEGVTERGRLTAAVGRARFIRHCQARYNITIAA